MSGEQQEPSMEEILASIRRIISEDPQPAEAAPPPADPLADFEPTPAAAAMPAAPVDEDPFASFEPTPVFTPEPAPQPEPVVDDVFELTPAMRLEPELEPEPEIIPQPYYRAPEPEPALQPEEEDRLMSAATEAAAASALAGLVVPKIMSSTGLEGLTVESIVRELLRPMLREWMDNNLPTLVERLVEAEIERLSRRPRL